MQTNSQTRSRRRPEYPRTNNNRLRGVRLYLQTVSEEETLLAELCELSEITVSISSPMPP